MRADLDMSFTIVRVLRNRVTLSDEERRYIGARIRQIRNFLKTDRPNSLYSSFMTYRKRSPAWSGLCRSMGTVAFVAAILLAADSKIDVPGAAGAPYPNMPQIAPIGVRIAKYMDVPESAKGLAIDPAKGYRLQRLGNGLYMITDNAYQSMFMTYETGVVVIDAPPRLPALFRESKQLAC
jgi:hypothetical protein